MTLMHYVVALIAIAAANWVAARRASTVVSKLLFVATASSPLIFWLGLNAWLLVRDGFSTFQDPYFVVLLMIVAGFTVATAVTAFLGRELARRSLTQTPR
jgi:hypothetical protein